MHFGMEADVIAYDGANDVTIRFEDDSESWNFIVVTLIIQNT